MRVFGKTFFLPVIFVIAVAHCAALAQTPKTTPTPAASPKKSPTPVQTLDELRSKIKNRILSPEASRGRVGVKIVSLKTGKVLFENDAEKYFIPASVLFDHELSSFTLMAAGAPRPF